MLVMGLMLFNFRVVIVSFSEPLAILSKTTLLLIEVSSVTLEERFLVRVT
jgi:hypothetical protein